MGANIVVAGSLWLAKTTDIENIVLNAAALAFILDVDEILYEALVPGSVKALGRALEPFSLSESSYVEWFSPVAHAVGVTIFILIVVAAAVMPSENGMYDIAHVMC